MVQVVPDEESLVCNKGMQEAITDGFYLIYNKMREDFLVWMQDENTAVPVKQLCAFEDSVASMEFEEARGAEARLSGCCLENNVRLVRTALETLVMTTPICFFSKELSAKADPDHQGRPEGPACKDQADEGDGRRRYSARGQRGGSQGAARVLRADERLSEIY